MDKSVRLQALLSFAAPAAVGDILESFRRVTLWSTLGWHDFLIRYRRTLVGPFWQTIMVAVWVLGLGLVFGHILQRTGENYAAYLAAGVVLWNYLSNSLSASTQVFVKHANLIHSVNNPLYTYALRQITENLARLGFQSLVFLAVLPITDIPFGPVILMAIPGFLAILLTSLWAVPLIGMLGARFRDLSYAISAVMRFLFFTTPVFWHADSLGERAYLAHFNPLTHFLEVVRAPLLGIAPAPLSWAVVLTITTVGALLTLLAFNRFRRRIVFWL